MRKYIFINLIICYLSSNVYAQNSFNANKPVIDSLTALSYEKLLDKIAEETDTVKNLQYANAYTKKGINTKDTLKIIRGYYFQTLKNNNKTKLELLDSVIYFSKSINNSKFLTIAHLDKGVVYYTNRDFESALDNYLKAISYNKISNNEYLEFLLNNNIGLLKSRIDYDEEALVLFKKCRDYTLKNNLKETDPATYFDVMSFLSHSYRKNKKLDSAYIYNVEGLIESKRIGNEKNYNHFVLNDGVISFYKKEYGKAYDSIKKSLPFTVKDNDLPNMAVGYYYLGKTALSLNKIDEAIYNFKKVDTVFKINNDVLPETREAYKILSKYYKDKNDLKNELIYIERLLVLDSLLNKNYKLLSKGLSDNYDKPNLISERQHIIEAISKKNNRYKLIVALSLLALLITIGLVFFLRKQNIVNKRKVEALLKEAKKQPEVDIENKSIQDKININSQVIESILFKLNEFEKNNGFINPSINLNALAHQFDTNSKYLSTVINHYKNKNFSSYLNGLRINYAVLKLKEEKQFRNYTIKAIGQEVGFNSAESFSKAFYKTTNLKPSFFLRELNK